MNQVKWLTAIISRFHSSSVDYPINLCYSHPVTNEVRNPHTVAYLESNYVFVCAN